MKNLDIIKHLLTKEQLNKIEYGSSLHRRFSNIQFEILKFEDNELTIKISQDKTLSGNYANKELLSNRAIEIFKEFLPDIKIITEPVSYEKNSNEI